MSLAIMARMAQMVSPVLQVLGVQWDHQAKMPAQDPAATKESQENLEQMVLIVPVLAGMAVDIRRIHFRLADDTNRNSGL